MTDPDVSDLKKALQEAFPQITDEGWDVIETVAGLKPDTDEDECPRCGHVQANVNNLTYLMLLRPDQRARRKCRNCGWRADV